MALKQNFYEEIYGEENNWIELIDSNLLNVYYLPELRNFYYERQVIVSEEYKKTLNPIMKSIWSLLNNIVEQLDFIMSEAKKDKRINLEELKNYFLINRLNNNISIPQRTNSKEETKKNLYELRKKITSDDLEDYLDDDFYYENQKVA